MVEAHIYFKDGDFTVIRVSSLEGVLDYIETTYYTIKDISRIDFK
ncbi:hypothetical protein ABE073_04375 [Lederbergia citrisecunda]